MRLTEIKNGLVRFTDGSDAKDYVLGFLLANVKVVDVAETIIESEFLDKSEVTSEEVDETFDKLKTAVSLMIGHAQNVNMATFVSHLIACAITEVNVTTPNDEAQEIIHKCQRVIPLLRKRLMMAAMIKNLDEEIMEKYICPDDLLNDHEDDDDDDDDDGISLSDLFNKHD